jgi:hypothetical protein
MQLSFFWWNTSLSPAVNSASEPSDEKRKVVLDILKELMEKDYDFICLCEISFNDVRYFMENLEHRKSGYEIINGTDDLGRTRFDICVIFKLGHIEQNKSSNIKSNIVETSAGQTLKIAKAYDFFIMGEKDIYSLRLFLSHWPSLLYPGGGGEERYRCAQSLRQRVVESFGDDNKEYIVLLGDYNCEPCGYPIEAILMASRERSLVQIKGRHDLLYNPCWKFMTLAQHLKTIPYLHEGTYYLKRSAARSCWSVFDQIIFSSAFVRNTEWQLDDQSVALFDMPKFSSLSSKYKFDHLPIIAKVLGVEKSE